LYRYTKVALEMKSFVVIDAVLIAAAIPLFGFPAFVRRHVVGRCTLNHVDP
jgi:hypothetical protein